MKILTSKFKVGEIVAYHNEFSFNEVNKVVTVGRIEAIHFFQGTEIGYRPSRGETKPRSLEGLITYTISGLNTTVREDELLAWTKNDE